VRLLLAMILLAPTVAAQDIQVHPTHPAPGEPAMLQTTVLGNVTWDFGDGRTAHGRSASHAFTYAGIYRVRVYEGQALAAETEVVVRIPASLYLDAEGPKPTPTPEPTPTPDTNVTPTREPPGGFWHYLTEHPLVLILVLGGAVGALMAGAWYVRKRRGQVPAEDADDAPAPAPPPPSEESLEDLLPGAEEVGEETEAPPATVEALPPAEEADLLSVVRAPAKKAEPGLDTDRLAKRLEE
jgi:hypothetical protein